MKQTKNVEGLLLLLSQQLSSEAALKIWFSGVQTLRPPTAQNKCYLHYVGPKQRFLIIQYRGYRKNVLLADLGVNIPGGGCHYLKFVLWYM